MTTAADSLAMRVIDAHGGWDAWASMDQVRFDWVVERDSIELSRVRHLWHKTDGRARVEWEIGEDSVAVALLDLAASTPEAPVGVVYLRGEPTAPEDSLVARAYGRFINDSYWMLAPLKTFDPGVNRGLAPDSASGGSDVLALSFGDVGLTPGDRYWLRVGPGGELQTWTYVLQGDTTATTWAWEEPATVNGPAGPLTVLTRKRKPDGTSIVTAPFATPEADDVWTSPLPLLR
jgi:hypothetical protein